MSGWTSGGTLCPFAAASSWVGYGLDFNEKYHNLRDVGTLAPHVYS